MPPDHRRVPMHHRRENGLLVVLKESAKQLSIGHRGIIVRPDDATDVLQHGAQRALGHDAGSSCRGIVCLPYKSRMKGEVVQFF